VAEAAPPPYLHDHGVQEAAPPPLHPPPPPVAVPSLFVRTAPKVPLGVRGGRTPAPYRLAQDATLPLVVGDGKRPWPAVARLSVVRANAREMVVRIESDRPLDVRFRGKVWRAPADVTVPLSEPAPAIVLVDRRTGARLKLLGAQTP
jgi:hypothetical protein